MMDQVVNTSNQESKDNNLNQAAILNGGDIENLIESDR